MVPREDVFIPVTVSRELRLSTSALTEWGGRWERDERQVSCRRPETDRLVGKRGRGGRLEGPIPHLVPPWRSERGEDKIDGIGLCQQGGGYSP